MDHVLRPVLGSGMGIPENSMSSSSGREMNLFLGNNQIMTPGKVLLAIQSSPIVRIQI
jgi:hypothetical protein